MDRTGPWRMSLSLAALTLVPLAGGLVQAAQPDPLAGAAARIERHRKADLVIRVEDAQGRPVPEAAVSVDQTRHAFLFGSNLFLFGNAGKPEDEEAYRARFAEVFNFATLPFYWPSYEVRRGRPDHARIGAMARWCQEHRITPKGHPLAWNWSDPRWLPDDLGQVRALQMNRITDCVRHFRGLIDTWDVVNEATHYERDDFRKRSPKLTALWDKVGRVEFVRECFDHARAANPRATLLINDYRTDQAYAKILDALVQGPGGRPFDVIGIQSHMHGGAWPQAQAWEVCERFARFGVPLHFTETTIVSGAKGWDLAKDGKPWPSTPEGEKYQADEVEKFYTVLFSHPSVEAITWWDFADRGSWMNAPSGFLRTDLSPKPAYDRLRSLIRDRWWTKASLKTDGTGEARLRAFLGEHKVTVRAKDGKPVITEVRLQPGTSSRIIVKLP